MQIRFRATRTRALRSRSTTLTVIAWTAAVLGGCGQTPAQPAAPSTASDEVLSGELALDTAESPASLDTTESPASLDTAASGSDEFLALAAASPRRTHTIAALMFDIGGGVPDRARIENILSGPGQSLTRMYAEISYGMQGLSVDMLGPYTLPQRTCLPIVCCGPKANQPNGPEAAAIIAALPKKYDHYFYVYGPIPAGATCGTWGDEGTPERPAVYASFSFHSLVGQTQELGHNFGMTHEPVMNCGAQTMPDDPSTCTHVEYGSTLSFMGKGPRHPSAYHKAHQGWLSGCNVVKVGRSDQLTLLPAELACDGTQLLQIKAPKVRAAPSAGDRQGAAPSLTHYYLELRAPHGFDTGLGPMVVVSIGPDLSPASRSAPYVYALDMVPGGTLDDAGLRTVGQTYRDPAGGLTITLDAIDARSATVTVTSTATPTASTCLDQTAFVAPGPGPTSCTGLATIVDGGATTVTPAEGGLDAAARRDAARESGLSEAGPSAMDAARLLDARPRDAFAGPQDGRAAPEESGAGGDSSHAPVDGASRGDEIGSERAGSNAHPDGALVAVDASSGSTAPGDEEAGGCACSVRSRPLRSSDGAFAALLAAGARRLRRRVGRPPMRT